MPTRAPHTCTHTLVPTQARPQAQTRMDTRAPRFTFGLDSSTNRRGRARGPMSVIHKWPHTCEPPHTRVPRAPADAHASPCTCVHMGPRVPWASPHLQGHPPSLRTCTRAAGQLGGGALSRADGRTPLCPEVGWGSAVSALGMAPRAEEVGAWRPHQKALHSRGPAHSASWGGGALQPGWGPGRLLLDRQGAAEGLEKRGPPQEAGVAPTPGRAWGRRQQGAHGRPGLGSRPLVHRAHSVRALCQLPRGPSRPPRRNVPSGASAPAGSGVSCYRHFKGAVFTPSAAESGRVPVRTGRGSL